VVASPALTATQKAEIEALLLSLADEPAARPVLEALGIDRFVHIDDAAYDSVREVFAAVEGGR
jgi:ABC-type phosphate/phosphonate transport system substrate-binding protein